MKLPNKFKPHLVTSKDSSGYILENVCLRHGMTFATNGRMAVGAINQWNEDQDPTHILIPANVCDAATKKRPKAMIHHQGAIEIKGNEFIVHQNDDEKTIFKAVNTDAEKYPNILKVLPEHKNPVSITFSAKLLKQLSDALGEEQVCLTFDRDDVNACIIVTPAKVHDRFGLLMPIRFNSDYNEPRTPNEALEKLRKLSKEVTTA